MTKTAPMPITNSFSGPGGDVAPAPQTTPQSDSVSGQAGFWGLLDQVLRGRESFFEEIFEDKNVAQKLKLFLFAIVVLSGFYGLTMGAAGLTVQPGQGILQMVSSAVKVPLLYLLTVAVCFPVLFIIIVLMGSRLSFLQTLTLISLAVTLNAVLLASCAPIILFFLITGSDYHFVKLLHVLIFAFSGGWAMMALWHGLRVMCEKSDLYPRQAIRILQVWILIFGVVGTQMAWSLRPFVGSPGMPFEVVRQGQEGNFYKAVLGSVWELGRGWMD